MLTREMMQRRKRCETSPNETSDCCAALLRLYTPASKTWEILRDASDSGGSYPFPCGPGDRTPDQCFEKPGRTSGVVEGGWLLPRYLHSNEDAKES